MVSTPIKMVMTMMTGGWFMVVLPRLVPEKDAKKDATRMVIEMIFTIFSGSLRYFRSIFGLRFISIQGVLWSLNYER